MAVERGGGHFDKYLLSLKNANVNLNWSVCEFWVFFFLYCFGITCNIVEMRCSYFAFSILLDCATLETYNRLRLLALRLLVLFQTSIES